MSEKELTKYQFLSLLGLHAISPGPTCDLPKIYFVSTTPIIDLSDKNNSIKTGYENFLIKKGSLKLLPFKDFDFVGKNVVCQKCCQKFASKMSYRAHIGTDICTRTYNGPNLIYLNYKYKHGRQRRKQKSKSKFIEELSGHQNKKNLLNPELLNTLQTRNNCYSDIVHQRVKNKNKNNSSTDDPTLKKPRGRPRKVIVEKSVKKRGRPRKVIPIENSKNVLFKENSPNTDDAVNNNLTAFKKQLSLKVKTLTDKFWSVAGKELRFDKDIKEYNWLIEYYQNNTSHKEEVKNSLLEKYLITSIENLEKEVRGLSNELESIDESEHKEKLALMLTKLIERRKELTSNSKEKIEPSNELFVIKNKENFHHKDMLTDKLTVVNKNIGVWLTENISEVETITLSDESDSIEISNHKNESCLSNMHDDKNVKSPNKCINFITNHRKNVEINYLKNSTLECKECNKVFASIAEWKMHQTEHSGLNNKQFLCKICGLKFKMYKNFKKHQIIHEQTERKYLDNNKNNYLKNLKCKLCNRQYNYLRSYYAHIKTHYK
ncbi:uncharacterized protein LOC126895055 [Daktulosphaira vitifoliae]|uniref:uncharacterized protein LOC126895055 n=1 Tax=Daktulosphaira vitifoliae TaxID=58002 RepID=UPI0021AAF974|nr:uncharacterized protein LOC126895055 [Daktulosphaira vitifoliae]XP_050522475.1 uncharacterized protein LOC126895055 [Daktulosphaira vitifoliae]